MRSARRRNRAGTVRCVAGIEKQRQFRSRNGMGVHDLSVSRPTRDQGGKPICMGEITNIL